MQEPRPSIKVLTEFRKLVVKFDAKVLQIQVAAPADKPNLILKRNALGHKINAKWQQLAVSDMTQNKHY